MTPCNPKQKAAALTLRSSLAKNAERGSRRLTIAFTPVQLQNILQESATKVQYHAEYDKVKERVVRSDSKITCATILDNQTDSPLIWLGYASGKIASVTLGSENQTLTVHDHP